MDELSRRSSADGQAQAQAHWPSEPACLDSYVLIHDGDVDSVATDKTCKIQPTWNAAVCTGDVGRLFVNKPGGTLRDLSAGELLMLHRNGKDHRITVNQSNVGSGTEMRVKTER